MVSYDEIELVDERVQIFSPAKSGNIAHHHHHHRRRSRSRCLQINFGLVCVFAETPLALV